MLYLFIIHFSKKVSVQFHKQTNTANLTTLTRVFAAKLDSRITHLCDALAVFLIAQVHAIGVAIAAPTHGDAQAIHAALELVCVATARGTGG